MPDRAEWTALLEAHGRARSPRADVPNHEPIAAVLACSDARVPPSVVFDQPAGSLFVVRIAGNAATPAALASLDYAVEVLGVELVVVLGHSSCGAVTAAAAGNSDTYLAPIIEPIAPVVAARPDADIDELVRANVARTIDTIARHPGPAGVATRDGRLTVRGAVHDLVSGRLETINHQSSTEQPTPMETS